MSTKDIEESFKNKESNEFYRYYYCNDTTKQLIECWNQLTSFYYDVFLKQDTSEWLFRGDIAVDDQNRSMKEAFKTSLDKAFEEFEREGKPLLNRNEIEKAILREFRRRAHLHTGDKDGTKTHLETLALLRHHFGPARILDWMYSFFPAVYFAVNRYDKKETYTIWALNREWVKHISTLLESEFLAEGNKTYLVYHFGYIKKEENGDLAEKKYLEIKRKLEYYKEYNPNHFQSLVVTYLMNKQPESFIYAANPYRLNERLAVQRGTLLFSGTVDKTWSENLKDAINDSKKNWPPKKENGKEIKGHILWEICLKLSKESRNEFLRRLDEMNINQVTLFPDLDGFAQSLRTRIAHPESLGITD